MTLAHTCGITTMTSLLAPPVGQRDEHAAAGANLYRFLGKVKTDGLFQERHEA